MDVIPTPVDADFREAVRFKKLHAAAITPAFATDGSAGFDLSTLEDVEVRPGATEMVRTGLVIAAPEGTMLLITPRSSTWRKWGVSLGNTIGIVDADYCGDEDELLLCLHRPAGHYSESQDSPYLNLIPSGTRLAQGIFLPVYNEVYFVEQSIMGESRGGWGSSNS